MSDDQIFGAGSWVYCHSHLRPHEVGWCTVPAEDKTLLSARTQSEAVAECRDRGFKIYDPNK